MLSQSSALVPSSSHTSLAARLSESLRSTPRDRKAGVYYPSEAGYCLRKLFYSYTEAPKIYGDDTLAIFALGDAVHEKITTMLRRTPNVRLIANEKSYVGTVDLEGGDGFTISGRLDDLVEMEVIENVVSEKCVCGALAEHHDKTKWKYIVGRKDYFVADENHIAYGDVTKVVPTIIKVCDNYTPIKKELIENAENQNKALETVVAAGEIAGNGGKPDEKVLGSDVPKVDQKPITTSDIVRKIIKRVFVVDVKTIKSFDYLDAPKREHVLQLTFYLRMLRETYPGICGKLLYIKKDDFSFKEYDVPYTDGNWRELISRLTILHRTLTSPALLRHGCEPESKFVKSMNWGCAYCSHRDKCEFDCGPTGNNYGGMRLTTPKTEAIEAFI